MNFNLIVKTYILSFLKVPPYLVLFPRSSTISGIAEANIANPTVRNNTWKPLPRVVIQKMSPYPKQRTK